MSRPACCEIDLSALQHNLKQVRLLAPNSKILAALKANAYGHGIERVAKALLDADGFGVACLEEAVFLRQQGIDKKIVLLEGFLSADELAIIEQHDLETVIHTPWQLEAFLQTQLTQPMAIWLKVNTGMNRLGLLPEEAIHAFQQLKNHQNVKQLQCMTHFADADDLQKPTMSQQIARFKEIASAFSVPCSLANSAAILGWPATHADWVRPGIMLYGVSPFADKKGSDHGLLPVMTLKSKIFAIQQVRQGDAIGYGGDWVCPEDMRVGVVAMGYADGYPRHAKSGTPVLVNDCVVPLVGRVSMDMLTIDLRKVPQAKVGDEVVLWGRGLPIEDVARASETFTYELLCGVQPSPQIRMKIKETI